MKTDPICGMNIDEDKAIKIEINGKANYFCSQKRKDKFLSNESEIYNFKNPKKEEVSKSFFTKMFPRKKRDIKDINDIFKDIEKSLKK